MPEHSRPPRGGGEGLVHVSEVISDAINLRRPAFSPPYDSPIEDRFAYHAVKYLSPSLDFEPQHRVPTQWGQFSLDFAARCGNKTIGIECDGRDYHQGDDAERDDWRDAIILGASHVDAMYRLRGSDIVRHPSDLLYMMSRVDPRFFSDRGRQCLKKLASPAAEDRAVAFGNIGTALVSYRGDCGISHLIIERRYVPKQKPSDWYDHHRLFDLYQFAEEYGAARLDEVRVAYWEQMSAA